MEGLMLVELKKEWLGNKPGRQFKLGDIYARQLIDRGTAIEVPLDVEPKIKIQRRDKDKMVENSLNK
jgi:hypothetical protein